MVCLVLRVDSTLEMALTCVRVAIAAQCAETQDVVFEAPDIVGAFPGTFPLISISEGC